MADTTADAGSIAGRYHFLIRRLHSLSGLVPIGVFLVVHLSINASINFVGKDLDPGEFFQKNVDRLHELGPLLVPVEIVGIFIPILFHAVLGLQIWFSGQSNIGTYHYGGNFRYTLQRVTGGIAFVFILYHLWHMHWLGKGLGGGFFDPHEGQAAITAAESMQQSILGIGVSYLYVVGVLAAVYHLANGIWTSLITWGITIGPRSQRNSGYACAVFGVALGLAGLSSVRGFKQFSVESMVVDSAAGDVPTLVTRSDHSE